MSRLPKPRRLGRRLLLPVAVCLAAWPSVSARAQADVLAPARVSDAQLFDLIPADAELVVIVPSASRLSDRLADFGQDTGLEQYAPELGNALTSFKRQMTFEQGLNDDGAMLLIVSGLADAASARAAGDPADPPTSLLLAPVRDYAAFVQQLGGDPQAPGPTPVTLADQTRGMARPMEGYALLGTAPHVEAYQPAQQGADLITALGGLPGRTVSRSDALLYLDARKLGPALQASLESAAPANPANPADQSSESWSDLLRPWLPLAQALTEGSDKVVLGLTLGEAGLEIDAALRLRDDSTLASYFADASASTTPAAADSPPAASSTESSAESAGPSPTSDPATQARADTAESQADASAEAADAPTPQDAAAETADAPATPSAPAAAAGTDDDLLARLPADPYILAGALAVDGETAGRLLAGLSDTLQQMPDSAASTLLRSYVDSFSLLQQTRGVASALYVPQPANMMSGGFFSGLTLYHLDDAPKFLAAQKQYVQQLGQASVPLQANADATPDADPAAATDPTTLTFRTSYTDRALVIDGTSVDQYAINYVLPPAMMQQFGPTAALLGNSGQSGYLAAKGEHALISTVADPQLITRGLRALDQTAGLSQSPAIGGLREQQLPRDAWLELYFNLGGVAQTVSPFLPMLLPAAPPLQVPADLPPLALAATSDGKSLLIRGVIPTALVNFGVQTYEQMAPALGPMLERPAPPPPGSGPPRAPRR